MTRINCVPVQELCNKHLFAEWRELPRLRSYIKKSLNSQNPIVIPENYVLGAGHVKFFYNKIEYLISRYRELTIELLARGYNIERKSLEFSFPEIPNEWYGRWVPSEDDLALNRQRIKERMPKDPKWTLT